ncbi:AAA family ATPase [Thermococcus sp.]
MKGVFQQDDRKTIETLFGREEEIFLLLSKLLRKDPVFIVGYRRVGKSSLAHAVSDLIVGDHFAHVYCERGFKSSGDIINRVKDTLRSKSESQSKSITTGKLIEFGFSKSQASRFIHEFESATIIILDEAQRVTDPGIIEDFLTWTTKHLGSTTRVILTGSEIQLLHGLFKRLHGKPERLLTLYPLEEDTAIKFILKGFKQNEFPISEDDAKKMYDILGGTPGAIIDAAEQVILEGEDIEIAAESEKLNEINMMLDELNKISKMYHIEPQTFTEKLIKSNWQVTDLSSLPEDERKVLENLIQFGFIKQKGEIHTVPDPVVKEALKEWGGLL